jgi:hypothetical protein
VIRLRYTSEEGTVKQTEKREPFSFSFSILPRSVSMACRGGVEDGAHPGVLDDEERKLEEVTGVEEEEDGRGRRRRRGRRCARLGVSGSV